MLGHDVVCPRAFAILLHDLFGIARWLATWQAVHLQDVSELVFANREDPESSVRDQRCTVLVVWVYRGGRLNMSDRDVVIRQHTFDEAFEVVLVHVIHDLPHVLKGEHDCPLSIIHILGEMKNVEQHVGVSLLQASMVARGREGGAGSGRV